MKQWLGLKCNVGVSWSESNRLCGASWIIRNKEGKALLHSRRAFTNVSSRLEAELMCFGWATESMLSLHYTNVVIESNCRMVREAILDRSKFPWYDKLSEQLVRSLTALSPYRVEHVVDARNRVAEEIAVSVTRDCRYQSYVASGGPSWLRNLLEVEARKAGS